MVEGAKRILTKAKIDRQLVGQLSSTPFMSIKDSYNQQVTFDTQDSLEKRIDRLTVIISKVAAKDNELNKQFKPKIFQSRRNFYDKCNYDQRNYQNRYRSNSGDRRVSFSSGIQCGQNYRDSPRYEQSYRNYFRRGSFRGNVQTHQNHIEVNIEEIIGMRIIKEAEVDLGKGNTR